MKRGIFLLFVCLLARGDSLDDAVASLAKKVTARLGPTETARVTARNISSLPAADASKAQAALNRALQRRVRTPVPVDVALTISENLRGYLLVAEIKREGETMVEMAEFRADAPAAPARAAITLDRKLVWEQDAAILDVAILDATGDQMLVLDSEGVSRYQRSAGKWERTGKAIVPVNSRDPRGRLEVSGDTFTAQFPGAICTGSSNFSRALSCETGGLFTARRNTQDLHDWRGEFFATGEIGSDSLLAELDGRTHIYDAAHAPQGVFETWGSDFIVVTSCGATRVVASSPSDRLATDSVALYDVVNRAPIRMSEPLAFPGPVTALWRAGDGALAVSRNLSTGRYAAYHLTFDCGR